MTNPSARRNQIGLNAVNFFLAQISDVVVPFLNVFLRQNQWRYDQIGAVVATSSFASLIFQIPAGLLCERVKARRTALAAVALTLGCCYLLIPFFAHSFAATMVILFVSGSIGTFFAPLLGSLALTVGGQEKLDSVIGENRGWNHAGNLVASLLAVVIVRTQGIVSLFFIAAFISMLAAGCCFVLRKEKPVKMLLNVPKPVFGQVLQLLRNSRVRNWLICISLFFVASGPVNSLVTLYMQHIGSSESLIAASVLVAQPLTIPVAWLTGKLSARWGRKPLLAIAFSILPLRLFLYSLTSDPYMILGITMLDGITAGIIGVLFIVISSDLTGGQSGFNSLLGLVSTTPALGAMTGTFLQGELIQHFDFRMTFQFFALIALIATALVVFKIRETNDQAKLSRA